MPDGTTSTAGLGMPVYVTGHSPALQVCASAWTKGGSASQYLRCIFPDHRVVACQVVMLCLHIAEIDELQLLDALISLPVGGNRTTNSIKARVKSAADQPSLCRTQPKVKGQRSWSATAVHQGPAVLHDPYDTN